METFRIGEAVKLGWARFQAHVLFVWLVIGASVGLSILSSLLKRWSAGLPLPTFAIALVSVAVGIILKLGSLRIFLDLIDRDEEDKLETLASQSQKALRYLGASILYGVVVMFGLIFFIVPGLYFILKYQFYGYLIVDRNLGAVEALKRSGEMTRGVKWKLAGFLLTLIGLGLLGALAFGVGLLVAIPIIVLADVAVYRALSKRLDPTMPIAESVAEIPVAR